MTRQHWPAQGIGHQRILKKIYDEEISEVERKYVCTKRDLLNVAKSYGINKVEKDANDHTSVDMYVSEI